jgi:hypothetical protein
VLGECSGGEGGDRKGHTASGPLLDASPGHDTRGRGNLHRPPWDR